MSWLLGIGVILCFILTVSLAVGFIVSSIMDESSREKEFDELCEKIKNGKYKVRFHL